VPTLMCSFLPVFRSGAICLLGGGALWIFYDVLTALFHLGELVAYCVRAA